MNAVVVENQEILYRKAGELIRISACGRNAIRFQSFPGCSVIDTDYNLLPQRVEAEIKQEENKIMMRCGELSVTLDAGGNVAFYRNNQSLGNNRCANAFCCSQIPRVQSKARSKENHSRAMNIRKARCISH